MNSTRPDSTPEVNAAPQLKSRALSPVDRVVFGYLAYIPLVVLVLGRPLADYSDVFLKNSLVAVAVALIVRFLPLGRHRLTDIIRLVYPALLFGYFYNQTGGLMRLVYPEFFDSWFVGWEAGVIGANPTLWLDRSFLGTGGAPWVTELLSMCYFSYYIMFPATLIPLLVLKRYRLTQEILTAVLITFAVSFNLFWFFPLEGPRWHFAEVYQYDITGAFFRPLVDFVIANGAVRGGCMPSTHTGVALVVLVYLYREYRKWFWVALPLVIGIGLGAVYGRFHYATDISVGAAIAAVCVWFTIRFYPRWASPT
ncbi:MAG: phosphatase PAP2 family protein [Candidatus Zixiibacteriota bacterium]